MGAGAALFDYDNDGDLDVFLVQGARSPPAATRATRTGRQPAVPATIFRPASGSRTLLRFTDVTDAPASGHGAYGMGAAVGDYDNDGDLDLFVTSFGPDALYRNNGDGTFTDVDRRGRRRAMRCGAPAPRSSTTTATAISICSSPTTSTSPSPTTRSATTRSARATTAARARIVPVPDRLYRNERQRTFVTSPSRPASPGRDGNGLGVARRATTTATAGSDLYVANDATPNQLWINRRDGTFADEGVLSGAAFNAAGNPEGSMGIASGDFDADGDEDLFVTNIIGETFALYVNDGKGSFEDARARAGLAQPTAAFTGFGTDWFDYDNDGWLDLFVANGAVNIIEAQRGSRRPFRMRDQLFRNVNGKRFEETSARGRPRVRARRSRPRRGVRRRRQRRRHRRAGDRRTAARCGCCSTRPTARPPLAAGPAASSDAEAVRPSARASGSSAPAGRRCGGASRRMAAISRRATFACTSGWAGLLRFRQSSSSGLTVSASDGRTWTPTAS